MARTQRVGAGSERTWTVVGADLQVVEPVEQYLEFTRAEGYSHNTVKAYARALAVWWTFLEQRGADWRQGAVARFRRVPPATAGRRRGLRRDAAGRPPNRVGCDGRWPGCGR